MHLPRLIIALSTITILMVVAIFGLQATMITDDGGNMSACPLMQCMESICRMNIMEHIGKWQSLFAASVPIIIALLSALTIVVLNLYFKDSGFLRTRRPYSHRNSPSAISALYNSS
jgi:hypothetical protein